MRSPSCMMLRSPARIGQGSTMWVTLLAATASPAAKLTVSRRSRYMSVHALVKSVRASAAMAPPRALLRDMDHLFLGNNLTPGNIEDMADRGRPAVGAALDAPVHRHRYLCLTEQEEFRVVRRPGGVERRAQHVAGAGRAHDARRHNDDEVGFFLLIRGTAGERTEHRHVGEPRQLFLVRRVDALQQARDREALAVAQFDRG